MKNLLSLLERFSKSLNKDSLTKESISQVILNRTKVNLLPDDISLKDGVLKINASAAAKNEISLKEGLIKDELKGAHHIFISRIIYK